MAGDELMTGDAYHLIYPPTLLLFCYEWTVSFDPFAGLQELIVLVMPFAIERPGVLAIIECCFHLFVFTTYQLFNYQFQFKV